MIENDCLQEKECSPETCHRADVKDFYNFQIEKFEAQKKYSSPDELKVFIKERKKYFFSEIQKCLPNINSNQNAKCYHNCFIWLLDFYNIEEEKLDKEFQPGIRSFVWRGSEDQKEALWNALWDAGYIHPDTTKETFIAIFSNDLTQCSPIHWTASNRLIAYLFDRLHKTFITTDQWKNLIEKFNLFINNREKSLKAQDLSTALSAIKDPGFEPRGYKTINTILENIKTV